MASVLRRWIRNRVSARRIRVEIIAQRRAIADVTRYEQKVHSQNGEDGIIAAIFAAVQTTNKYFVEFGVGSGQECNTAYLASQQGWTGLWMEAISGESRPNVTRRREFVTAENITALFEKHGVPEQFDLLSIDLDGNDYWVWKAITKHRPRVVVIEYNASVPATESRVIVYDPEFRWSGTDYFGASLLALQRLGAAKGYTLVGCDRSGTNAFFVEEAAAHGHFLPADIARLYRPPAYGAGKGHPRDETRRMVSV